MPWSVAETERIWDSLKFRQEARELGASHVGIVRSVAFDNRRQGRLWYLNRYSRFTQRAYGVTVSELGPRRRETARLMAREGLETAAIRTGVRLDARCTDAMQVVARRFALPTWSKTRMSDHSLLEGASEIVVWGAGGLVEILLANYFDPARIDFFIDRNGGKRDWVCLGRPIRPPEALGSSPRTVLINSVDFAESIAADLERLYPGVGHRVVRIADLF